MLQYLIQGILDIFIDRGEASFPQCQVKDLTEHYRGEVPLLQLDSIYSASHYSDTKSLIESYKYFSQREKLIPLAQYLSEIYRQTQSLYGEEEWYIVPVPMHWSRYSIRGFDHMELIAREVSKSTHIPYISLLSTRYRPRQTQFSREVRLANKKNAFKIRSGFNTVPENIILIDDIISSGSTVNACAQVLKESGTKKIVGWFLASNN